VNSYLTIGEVVQRLKREFTDLSVSKLRYLEDEGLIEPSRTESGYRQFSVRDVERITLILRLQERYFLPLSVINKKLRDYDLGASVPEIENLLGSKKESADTGAAPATQRPLNLNEAAQLTKTPESFILELKNYGIVGNEQTGSGPAISSYDLECIKAAWELRTIGVEPRHLRMYATFADRESLIYEQLLRPTYRHKTPESRSQLKERLDAIDEQTRVLKIRLLNRDLRNKLSDLL